MTSADAHTGEARLRQQARQFLEAGQWDAAKAAFEELVQRAPRDVPLRMELADLMLRRGQMRAASSQLLQAAPLLPNDVPMIAELAWRLSMTGETLAMRACAERLERAPDPPGWVLAEQAHLRWMLGDIPAARARMDLAVAAGIDSQTEYYLNAMLLQFTGRLAEAEVALLETLRRWPDYGDAAVILANLRRQTAATNHLGFLRERLGRLPRDSTDMRAGLTRAKFESAIFKVFDDLGRHDEAWQALERSNALMHSFLPYDADSEAAVTDALIEVSATALSGKTGSTTFDGPMPIFIVGMPRSGSTLLDHMLSAHSAVTSAGEINDFQRQLHWIADVAPRGNPSLLKILERTGQLDFDELGARYLMQTQWRAQGRKYFIDKLPINVRMVPFIRRALPRAPILHLARDPMDVCYSNLKIMFGSASPYCYDMQAVSHYYGQYARLTNHWREALPNAMLDIPYASLVRDPEATMRQVLGHCGLEIEEACLRPELNTSPVATPSSAQVRESIHTRGIAQWRHYEKQLEPLRQALAAELVSNTTL
ncbi:sulfotransferase family protein [Rhodanobacter glycinis]|uniref:Sulfotransferase family protein n=1 Tax=Rhodanobacter glycinis TaxID=582702 RepID=A0A502CAX2_9GAMM|nr:sulfotransferase [Rhodanobacter glycinis]TPG09840.1 sulfotransferase family protein [Rhodanobacter glycinis]